MSDFTNMTSRDIRKNFYPDFSLLLSKCKLFEHWQLKDGTIKSFRCSSKNYQLTDDTGGLRRRDCLFRFRSLRYVMGDGKVIHVTLRNYYLSDDIPKILEHDKRLDEVMQNLIQEDIYSDPMCMLMEEYDDSFTECISLSP